MYVSGQPHVPAALPQGKRKKFVYVRYLNNSDVTEFEIFEME